MYVKRVFTVDSWSFETPVVLLVEDDAAKLFTQEVRQQGISMVCS